MPCSSNRTRHLSYPSVFYLLKIYFRATKQLSKKLYLYQVKKTFFKHQTSKIMLNQIKQITILSLSILCIISCQSIGKKSQVSIESKSVDVQNMTQNDKFGDKRTDNLIRNTPLNKNEHFPMFYTIMLNNKVRAMYVRPENKNVTIVDRLNSSGLDRIDSLDFVGVTYPDENIILQEINRRFSVFQGYTLGLYKRSRDLKDAYNSSKRIYDEEQAYMKEAFKKYKTGRDFRKALRREVRYSYICNLIGPYSKSGTNVDSISTVYIRQVDSVKKELRNIIKTRKGTDRNVHETVYDFNRFLSRQAMKTDTAFEYQWLMAEQNFKGETREYLKFKLLKENFGATPQYNTYFEQFKKGCKDRDFIDYLDKLSKKNDHIFNASELASALSDTSGQTLTWADILAKNKGKKIYLVASEFGDMPFFNQQFDGKMNDFEKNETNVIVISSGKVTSKMSSGMEIIGKKPYQQYKIATNESAFSNFLNPKGAAFRGSYCILIDKDGKVVLTDAADPQNFGLLLRQMKYSGKGKVIMP